MILYRISACKHINDLTGTGASLYGGRWNSLGIAMTYTAGSPSLAMLETLVHLGGRITGNFCQLALEAPEDSILTYSESDLPTNWREHPAPDALKKLGNKFILEGKYLCMKVPSVIVPEEFNCLINPEHPDFDKITVLVKGKINFDNRLVKGD